MIPGAGHADRAEGGVNSFGAIGDEGGVMACAAIDARTAIAAVAAQDLFDERGADGVHRSPHGQLYGCQRVGFGVRGGQGGGGQLGQAAYLGGGVGPEVSEEPPFSAPVTASGSSAAAGCSGRASQIASLTSTISAITDWNVL